MSGAGEPGEGAMEGGVAIIGMAGRFPGAASLAEFWGNLYQGVESISRFTAEETAGIEAAVAGHPRYVPAGGVLADVERFDAAFFGLAPREAELMDPQQRLFLECAHDALEDAGCDPDRFSGLIGVYAGVGANTYAWHNLLANPAALKAAGSFRAVVSSDKDFLTTGVSYRLNLRGPSFALQCACSTSLVAVHVAVQALLGYDCDVALAGGVRIGIPQHAGYVYQEGGILSPDGRCRAFDERAAGTVAGNGAGLVVLKRLAEAVADGDTVRAVIRGSAVNNDGAHKVGFAAPSVEGQSEVIAAALATAGIGPADVSYVEAHGTGTALGDPIELRGLTDVFAKHTAEKQFCALGSVKSNIGHLDVASGIAGLIKTVLALEHRLIPPSLHFERPNPRIDFAASPFFVNREARQWETDRLPRRAGVSSFGIGGTNAHVVLEEAPQPVPASPGRPWQLLVLSAKTPAALEQASRNLARHLRNGAGAIADLSDIAFTLQTGRRQWRHRRAVICRDQAEAAAALEGLDPAPVLTGGEALRTRPVVFMFPGQGAQYLGMGAGLYRDEPLFRREVDACAELLLPHLGSDLRLELYPPAPGAEEVHCDDRLAATRLAQPALFTVEYALARLWLAWGVRPAAMIGHSLGEYVAACLAGVISLADALELVAWRGKLIQQLPGGSMLSVAMPEAELLALLATGVEGGTPGGTPLALAAVNGPASCVASGEAAATAALETALAARGVRCRRLHTSHAFHSPMVEPVLAAFEDRLRRVELHPPEVPYLSNLTGTWITAPEAVSPGYWVSHLRRTVRFGSGLAELRREPNHFFLEVGPGRGLQSLLHAAAAAGTGERPMAFSSLPPAGDPRDDLEVLTTTLGRVWLAGIDLDWQAVHHGEHRRRRPLPTYPYERRRHWIEPIPAPVPAAVPATVSGTPAPRSTGAASLLDEPQRAIADLWMELLGVEEIGETDDFFDLGGHSVLALHLASRFEERFGVHLPLAALSGRVTVASLASCLPRQPARRSSLRVEVAAGGTLPPFWCVHPIGGTTLCYRALARQLRTDRADRPFIALQAAGLEGDEPPATSVESMAARYLEELLATQPAGPYLLGGWSFGGLVAYEMARQLIESGHPVARLVLIDSLPAAAAPGNGHMPDDRERAALLRWFLYDLAAGAGRIPAGDPMSGGPPVDLSSGDPASVLEQAAAAGVLPSRDLGERLFAVFCANAAAAARYSPRPARLRAALIQPAEPALPSWAADLGLAAVDRMAASRRWSGLVEGGHPMALHTVAGNHYTMLLPPHVEAMAAWLRRYLEED